MNRRSFIFKSSVLATGIHFRNVLSFDENILAHGLNRGLECDAPTDLYTLFKNPPINYHPFVRWWWNGDKVERNEISRELRLLKEIGIGGVEINPVKFPARTEDMGKPSLQWLSDEWIDMVKFAFSEAKSLGLTCDLIVGSGWPFGAEWLEGEERSQIVVVGTKKLEGPLDYEVSTFDLFKTADPNITSPFPGRTLEMMSVFLAPAVINSRDDIQDLSKQISTDRLRFKIPPGKFVLYAIVKMNSFAQVIQGAPGATGPVLNHYNKQAVEKYLSRMSDTIQQRIGPLSSQIRSLFTDSMELEGANWCADMQAEFQRRRGYDLMPWLPFILYKIEGMGNTWVFDYGSEHGTEFKEMINRMRYDFELTKAELIKERFVDTYTNWCKKNKVQSRMQAYGRGYFLLEGGFAPDIPECETWIKAGLGTEMSETDYRIGRSYTMINKFVSSAAHLKGKKLISCEELTNTDVVFNETLELMKVAADQSTISGVTHPIFHGFNYSPPEAPFPGWMVYGCYINEKNPWWPYFHLFNEYKARLSALLQQSTMFADMAVLPATADTWTKFSAQNEPFPSQMYPEWQTFIWESIHQNGNACDYVSEKVIQDSTIQNGWIQYGPRKYHSIFLTQIDSLEVATAKKLFEFVEGGGKIFFVDTYPSKSVGWKEHETNDKQVQEWISKIKTHTDRCIFLNKPGKDYTSWFKEVQEKFGIAPYLKINSPNKFITQVRYQAKDAEMIIVINSNMNQSYEISLMPGASIISKKQAWLWNAEDGERYKINYNGTISLELAPSDLKILVFDKEKKGQEYLPLKKGDNNALALKSRWTITGRHINGNVITKEFDELKDLKDLPDWVNFCGMIEYQHQFAIDDKTKTGLNLGKVWGVSEVFVNGNYAGVQWWGNRIYPIKEFLRDGNNEIVIKIVTTIGNYMKSLTENKIAQYWTNEGRKNQPVQSMGLLGPVTIY